jgi:hypothetical protein
MCVKSTLNKEALNMYNLDNYHILSESVERDITYQDRPAETWIQTLQEFKDHWPDSESICRELAIKGRYVTANWTYRLYDPTGGWRLR